jgi:D-xylose transport system substrate-binding protein
LKQITIRFAIVVGAAALSLSTAACSGARASAPSISAASFTGNFGAMSKLKPLASRGEGNVAVILPDTATSARYTEFDAPYLRRALSAAGLTSSQFTVQNAPGSDATELSYAQTAITKGASVLIMDPLDSGVGAQIEKYAAAHGAAVIDYDRLTLGGSRNYYVSFNNVQAGALLGVGLAACASSWKIAKPKVLVMYGAPTDNDATLLAEGYTAVLNPHFHTGVWAQVGKISQAAGTWDPPTALTEFRQQVTAHPDINAVLTPNDENAARIIAYLKSKGMKPKTFPVTGQDAGVQALQSILSGYQCGTVYKPFYQEAQAAAALAMYLRAGVTPPAALVNGQVMDTTTNISVPSVLLTPIWVTTANIDSTVIAGCFIRPKQLCTRDYLAACTAAGIWPPRATSCGRSRARAHSPG